MPVSASCPSCGAALSEASVLALAPICSHCGVVITSIGGTLGLTSAYGVRDPTITRSRVEADLAVFREYQMKYRGMLEACKQQLDWGVERYAQLPRPPELLKLEEVPPLFDGSQWLLTPIRFPFYFGATWIAFLLFFGFTRLFKSDRNIMFKEGTIKTIAVISLATTLWVTVKDHFKAKAANGSRPRENARRQKLHEESKAAALKAAEPLKAAEDNRLRCQIRELEGLAKTVAEKEADVRRILAKL